MNYCGIDLHSNNCVVIVSDENDESAPFRGLAPLCRYCAPAGNAGPRLTVENPVGNASPRNGALSYLGDNTMSTTILDRLMHHCHLLEFDGRSYRLKEAAETLARKTKSS
jgi:hypothetical protein